MCRSSGATGPRCSWRSSLWGEAGAALLEPWPLKIVLDNLLQHRALPGWMAPAATWIGGGPLAILNVAVVAVAAIALAGALSWYLNTWLTATVGQWVMHDLRRTLYHHIHRLSLAEHAELHGIQFATAGAGV